MKLPKGRRVAFPEYRNSYHNLYSYTSRQMKKLAIGITKLTIVIV